MTEAENVNVASFPSTTLPGETATVIVGVGACVAVGVGLGDGVAIAVAVGEGVGDWDGVMVAVNVAEFEPFIPCGAVNVTCSVNGVL